MDGIRKELAHWRKKRFAIASFFVYIERKSQAQGHAAGYVPRWE